MFTNYLSGKPEIIEFKLTPDSIEVGDISVLSWSVAGADSISIEGIGNNLQFEDRIELRVFRTTSYILTVHIGQEKLTQKITLNISPRPVSTNSEVNSSPAHENKNLDKSKYMKGIVNAENVLLEDNPQLVINIIESSSSDNKIKLYCSVKDQFGNHVANLAPPYNKSLRKNWRSLVEQINGKDHQIYDFNVEEIRSDIAPPFTTAFVLDYSGSMGFVYSFVDMALKRAVNYLRPYKDDYVVYQFDNKVVKSVDLNSKPSNSDNILPFSKLGGSTAFYNASFDAMDDIKNSEKDKICILFTDGIDNASLLSAYDIVLKARETGIKVFIVGINRPYGGILVNILQAIVDQTGGKIYFPEKVTELTDIFSEIYHIMNVHYVISYKTSDEKFNRRIAKLNFEFPGINKVLSSSKIYYVNPEKIEESRILSVAWFEVGKSKIKDEFYDLIYDITHYLNDNPNKKIKIIGHTDSKGSDKLNDPLSLKRAKSLEDIFLQLGVNPEQIVELEGKGNKEPLYPVEINESEEQGNRRVDVELL